MARVFYLGAPSKAGSLQNSTVGEALKATGNNTGNLLIGHAIKRHLKAEVISSDQSLGRDYISKNFDYVVIGASNFLFPGFDFGMWADFLEPIQLPCAIIGVGAQAPNYGCRVDVPKGTVRLMKLISERSRSMGARGEFTASTLAGLGIKNVRITGCPAMYWNCQPSLQLCHAREKKPVKVALNGSANVSGHAMNIESAKNVEAQLARLSLDRNYPYILQNEDALMEIAVAKTNGHDPSALRGLMSRYGLSDLSPEVFVRFIQQNTRSYFDVEQWHAAIKQFDFVVGSRFHGCLIGLLAGVPSFTFVHDTRTRELCELLKAPHQLVTEAGAIDFEQLYSSLDLKSTEAAYRGLYSNYVDFLEENHIEHQLRRS